ncbi:hypothetical protein AYO43_10525 [Nitrospira sp. SCGC AG-212-E16]|nr:hypothetical protein AYO43_10525 [Nitrospira sp. SCGC AG-212-E16]
MTMNITINGQRVAAEPGDTVYQAAKKAGIVIPSLCASDHLNPFGSCRLCLCEVEGQSGTPATCTTPVREGLVVQTESKRLQRLRRNIIELYLSEQPAAGPVPEALQRLAISYEVRSVRYHNPARRPAYRDDSNPFFSFDNAGCVSCARCVRLDHGRARIFGETCRRRPAFLGQSGRLCRFKLCLVRSLREGMSDWCAYGEDSAGAGGTDRNRAHDVRLLRGGLCVRRRYTGWSSGGDDTRRRWAFESGTCLYEGTVRLDL